MPDPADSVRTLCFALSALVLATAAGAATPVPATPADTLTWAVEGHAVHRNVSVDGNAVRVSGHGTHPAPVPAATTGAEGAGDVHWFDDSLAHTTQDGASPVEVALVVVHSTHPVEEPDGTTRAETLCGGTTWAAPPTVDVEGLTLSDVEAVAAYRFDGPNGGTWTTTEFVTPAGEPAWAAEDDCVVPQFPYETVPLTPRDGSGAPGVGELEYNAILWVPTGDLVTTGSVSFGADGLDASRSTVDGNAHAYNRVDAGTASEHSHATLDLRVTHRGDITDLPVGPLVFVNDQDYTCWHDHDGDGCT